MRCSTYTSRSTNSRCKDKATMWLLHPDGTRNPGGYVCEHHGNAVLTEYREKLNEIWGSELIDDNGHKL